MARTDNLNNFLTDVANAIRLKKGYSPSDKIQASTYDTEISTINTINNQDKIINSNGTYTADQGYTGLGQVIVNVAGTPDGVFIQGSQPTKVTDEAIWLEEKTISVASVYIPQNKVVGVYNNMTFSEFMNYLRTEQPSNQYTINNFDASTYHIITRQTTYGANDRGVFYGNSVAVTKDGVHYYLNFAPNAGKATFYGHTNQIQLSVSPTGDFSMFFDTIEWSDVDIYYENTLLHAADYNLIEDGLHIDVNNTRYVVYTNKSNSWDKILDTSNADAMNFDIINGKIAYANNKKLIGTIEDGRNNIINFGNVSNVNASAFGLNFDISFNNDVVVGNNTQAFGSVSNTDIINVTGLSANELAPSTNIFGISGTYTSDANANSSDIINGKTAYVNGVKVTGILEPNGGNDINYVMANDYQRAMLIGETIFILNYAKNFYGAAYYGINMNNTLSTYGLASAISLSGLRLTDARLTNLSGMCKDRVNLLYGPNFEYTGAVTDMSNMFSGCINMKGVANYYTRIVANMSHMFAQCNYLGYDGIPIPNFDTSNVVDMSGMFLNCFRLNYIPNFDTSNVTNMADMFNTLDRQKNYQANITECPNFNTHSVINMAKMLRGTKIINAPNFDMSSVKDASGLFTRCYNLSNVPNYVLPVVSNVAEMFSQCNNLVDAPNINLPSSIPVNTYGLFKECTSLVNAPSLHMESSISMQEMFVNCNNLANIGDIYAPNVMNVKNMFVLCRNLAHAGNIYAPELPNTVYMFSKCNNLIEIGEICVNNANNIAYTVLNCGNLTRVGNIYAPNALSTIWMFYGCNNLVDIGEIYAPNLTSASSMFFATGQGNLSNNSIRNIINMCINATNYAVKNLSNINSYSPFYGTKFNNSYYTDMWSDLDNAGWTY